MIDRYRDGAVPAADSHPALAAILTSSVDALRRHVERFELTEAIEAAWESVRALNRFVEERAPWTLAMPGARRRSWTPRSPRWADGVRVVADPCCERHAGTAEKMLQGRGRRRRHGAAVAAPGPGGAGRRASRPSARRSRASTSP